MPTTESGDESRPCILIVDDLPGHLGGLLDFLHDAGYEVRVAASGEIALERLERTRPDIILLDVNMPGIDGYETCRRLKADPGWREVPVLFLTAQSDLADKVRGFEVGAVDFISKPLHAEEVLARVRAHLQIRSLQQTLADQNELLRAAVALRAEAEAQLQESLQSAVLIVQGRDAVGFCTRLARQLLGKHFPDHDDPRRLPAALADWAESAAQESWCLDRAGSRLEARLFAPRQPGHSWLLTLEETLLVADAPSSLLRLGLTTRETEVLYWLSRGKSNPEIAIILGAALNTIKRHVQNILVKLGVESRLAAALQAAEILGTRSVEEQEVLSKST